jgi:OOP family OmpA-OmpF porin
MRQVQIKSVLAVALLAATAAAAHAEGAYVTGALTAPRYGDDFNGVGGGGGGAGVGAKIAAGYQFTPNLAVEGGYADLGRSHDINGTAKGQALFVDGVASVEVAPKVSVHGSIGVAEGRLQTNTQGDDRSPALLLGVGADYALTDTTALTVGYDHYRFADAYDGKPSVGQALFGIKVKY